MTENFQTANPTTARIYNRKDVIIGSGFLISAYRLLTCAHVIKQALGLEEMTTMPQDLIKFDLPLHFGQTAKVIFWQPCSSPMIGNAKYGEDIAVLQIIEPILFNETFPNLSSIDENGEQEINLFGFPENYDNGVWTKINC